MGCTIFVYHSLFEVAVWVTGKHAHISILVQLAGNCQLQNEACLGGCCLEIEGIWFPPCSGNFHWSLCMWGRLLMWIEQDSSAVMSQQLVTAEKEAHSSRSLDCCRSCPFPVVTIRVHGRAMTAGQRLGVPC